jgi:F-box/WD-40 domain protein 7
MRENIIVSGSSDSTVKIWSLNIDYNGRSKYPVISSIDIKTLEGHESDVYCLDFNKEFIVSSGADSKVLVWNFEGKLIHEMNGHLGVVRYILMDDYKVVSGGDAKKIIVWDLKVSFKNRLKN